MKQTEWDIVGLGTVVVDHLVTLSGSLKPDTKHEISDHRLQVGGPVPTALVMLQRWGLRTSFIGGWGNDALGALIDKNLGEEDVHTDYALRHDKSSGFAHVWLDPTNATRTIAFHRSKGSWSSLDLNHVPWNSVRLLHLDGWPTDESIEAAKIAKQHGCLVSLDTGSVKPSLEQLLPLVDVLNCSLRFVTEFLDTGNAEEGARQLIAMGPKCVTVTNGANGAWIGTKKAVLYQPAFAVVAVDTTGAGDTFTAAVIYGFLQKWDPDKILKSACAAAAIKCSKMGNRDALPTLDETQQLASPHQA